MQLSKERLINLIKEAKQIKLVLAKSSPQEKEDIEEAILNDFVLQNDGTLELWHNTGYEI